ncbi:hypothetical protein COBT_001794 [Conglomerata obtusa]
MESTDKTMQSLNKYMEEILTEKKINILLTKIILETSDLQQIVDKNNIQMFSSDQTQPIELHNFFYEIFFTILNKHESMIQKYNILGNILVLHGLINT